MAEKLKGAIGGFRVDGKGFLTQIDLRPLPIQVSPEFRPVGLALGKGPSAVEVAILESMQQPSRTSLKEVWKARQGRRAAPVLLVAIYQIGHEQKAALCGPLGEDPPTFMGLDLGQVERVCLTALSEPDRHSALRFLYSVLEDIDTPLAGLRNEGLLSSHQIQVAIRERTDLQQATAKGQSVLPARGQHLMRALGFEIQPLPGPASVLLAGPRKIAVAVFLERDESAEVSSIRFSGLSPVSYALAKADEENLPYVIISSGPLLRLHPVRPEVGVGRRGRTETFVAAHLELLRDDQAALLWYLFSAEALSPGGSLEQFLEESRRYATGLGERLQSRIYDKVVPKLATALAMARNLSRPTQQELSETYQMALTLLFRLLFIAYAEDKDLLPYKTNESYRNRSLKQKAMELVLLAQKGTPFDTSTSQWEETWRLFRAVDKGNVEWGVPEYNGGLFSEKQEISPIGASLSALTLRNDEFGPILRDLLLDETEEGFGPVDFRSLGVRDFGTIYEGLLESELSVADMDLDVDNRGNYIPSQVSEPIIREGEVYLHNRSGTRKATGSFFTKSFAVEHLLNHALEPALDDHLSRLSQLSEDEAGYAFFDFRVADIAMGSGHFLVAAVDRIERRLSNYLARHSLGPVAAELVRLRASALEALGPLSDRVEIEDTQLLRRQIARRCIYGVDINPLAVELARLSLWVHTFIPGLPLSLLDYHLVQGNSLVGIATLTESQQLVEVASGGPLFNQLTNDLMAQAAESIARVGRLADTDAAEIARAREALHKAQEEEKALAAMLDILVASRIDAEIKIDPGVLQQWRDNPADIPNSELWQRARDAMAEIPPFHFPVQFPDVFQRERSGFDVIIGNPPWEKARVEEHGFWARYFPGFKGVTQSDREELVKQYRDSRPDLEAKLVEEIREADLLRLVLTTGPYPGMGTGDPDLYKAFCWRFWRLAARPGGRIGVVLPRSTWSVKGSELFRKLVFREGRVSDLTILLNTGGWVFDDAEHRYTIALSNLETTHPEAAAELPIRGPYHSLDRYHEGIKDEPVRFPVEEVLGWTDSASLPLLPSEESAEVFAQLRKTSRLDMDDGTSWRLRPYRELDATNDKGLMTFTSDPPKGFWPVFTGASFDLWEPDKGPGSYYAWIDSGVAQRHLFDKRVRASRGMGSPFSEFPQDCITERGTLPCLHPRIAFRDVTNRTNRRTVIAALIPPNVTVQHKAPYLLRPRGDEKDEAFLLAILCSLPLDWYARRFVETSLTFFVLNPFPVPRPSLNDPCFKRMVVLAGRLASPDERFAKWAGAVGVHYGPLEPDEKEDMIHELDAVVAHLYGLSERQFRHIFETFHEGWDYSSRMEATLKHYRFWQEKK